MSSKEVVLNAEAREVSTRGSVNKIRNEGRIPAILYGGKDKNVTLVVNSKEFNAAIHTDAGEHAIISLKFEAGGKKQLKNVIVKEVQIHPVMRNVLHVDFLQISLTQEIEVTVAVETVGLPEGVDVQGGVLDQVTREIRIKCLPTEIPDKIEVDVSALNIHDSIKISDLKVPSKVEILEDLERMVASVIPPTVIEEEPKEEVVAEGEEGAEPEVIGKGKKEEDSEEAADGKDKTDGKGKAEEKGKPEDKGKPEEKKDK